MHADGNIKQRARAHYRCSFRADCTVHILSSIKTNRMQWSRTTKKCAPSTDTEGKTCKCKKQRTHITKHREKKKQQFRQQSALCTNTSHYNSDAPEKSAHHLAKSRKFHNDVWCGRKVECLCSFVFWGNMVPCLRFRLPVLSFAIPIVWHFAPTESFALFFSFNLNFIDKRKVWKYVRVYERRSQVQSQFIASIFWVLCIAFGMYEYRAHLLHKQIHFIPCFVVQYIKAIQSGNEFNTVPYRQLWGVNKEIEETAFQNDMLLRLFQMELKYNTEKEFTVWQFLMLMNSSCLCICCRAPHHRAQKANNEHEIIQKLAFSFSIEVIAWAKNFLTTRVYEWVRVCVCV